MRKENFLITPLKIANNNTTADLQSLRDAFKNAATIEDAAVAEAELKRARIDLGLLQRQEKTTNNLQTHKVPTV